MCRILKETCEKEMGVAGNITTGCVSEGSRRYYLLYELVPSQGVQSLIVQV